MKLDRRALLAGAAAAVVLPGCVTGDTLRRRRSALVEDFFKTTPENQAATFANMDELGPSRLVARGRRTQTLPVHARALDGMRYEHEGAARTIEAFMAENRAAGLIILKDGARTFERYAMRLSPRDRWAGFSVAKPITSTLVGCALAEGAIASLDDPMERYAPEFRASAYEGVRVRNLLRLMSGIQWNEDYESSGGSGIASVQAAVRSRRRDALTELMRSQTRAAPQGQVFNYNTGEAYVLGRVVAGATGRRLADYLSAKIWRPQGMETDAYWLTCGEDGPEVAGYGVSATLRDFARFGEFVRNDGVVGDRRYLPEGWRDLAGQPDNPVTANGALEKGYPIGHAYMWWSMATGADALPGHDGAFMAQGIFGQIVYVNPKERVVAALLSAWREPWSSQSEFAFYAMMSEAVARLR